MEQFEDSVSGFIFGLCSARFQAGISPNLRCQPAGWRYNRPATRLGPMDPKSYERCSRQILFGEIGEAGQQRLLESSAVIVGCGALGTALAKLLVRAGVGTA